MDAAHTDYHPSGPGAADAAGPALDYATDTNGNHATTLQNHNGLNLGDAAVAAAAVAAATAGTSRPASGAGGAIDSDTTLHPSPSPLDIMPSAPSVRGNTTKTQTPKISTEKLICQVDDCHAPLEGLKDYHQRYKVCDVHLKIEWIEKDGIQIRFCQQCGRFQPLEDFDDMKRSCRARLQKHNARRRKRTRDTPGDAMTAAGVHHGLLHDPAAAAAIAAGFNSSEVAAMQQAMQFASATLMQTTAAAQGAGIPGMPGSSHAPGVNAMIQPQNVDVGAASASASIAGMPFGGALQSMPFIPSKEVMIVLLKGYAGMFHYNIDNVKLTPRAPPTTAEELAAPMEAAAAAAAAAMTAGMGAVAGGGALGNMMGGDESAAAHLMAIQAQQAAEAVTAAGGGGDYVDPSTVAAAAAAAAAAMAGSGGGTGAAGLFNPNNTDVQGQQQHVDISALPPSIQ